MIDNLNSLDTKLPLSNSSLSSLISYNSLIKSNSSLISPSMVNKVSSLILDQIDLISKNLTTANPYFVELLDLQLYLAK